MNGWQRPAGPLNVWKLVPVEVMNCGGQVEQDLLSIQEIPENRMDEALDFFIRYVAPKDPVFCDLGVLRNPVAVHELRIFWSFRLKQGISIGAYRTDRDLNILNLVGIQLLHVEVPPLPAAYLPLMMNMKSPQVVNFMQFCLTIPTYNMFETFTVKKYLCGTSLGVYPAYGGGNLERLLLNTVEDVCRKYEMKVIGSLFYADQVGLAESAGYFSFQYLSRVHFYSDKGPAPNPTKLPKFMYRKLA